MITETAIDGRTGEGAYKILKRLGRSRENYL